MASIMNHLIKIDLRLIHKQVIYLVNFIYSLK